MPRLTQSVADTVDYFAAINAGIPTDTPPMKDLRILDLLDEVAALTEANQDTRILARRVGLLDRLLVCYRLHRAPGGKLLDDLEETKVGAEAAIARAAKRRKPCRD